MNTKRSSRFVLVRCLGPMLAAGLVASACAADLPDRDAGRTEPLRSTQPDPASNIPVADVDWGECPEGSVPPEFTGEFSIEWRSEDFTCGTLTVPLDYDEPEGRQIEIAVGRLSAARPDERIGTLFVNPGGPGGSGMQLAADFGERFPGPMEDLYDIIGFDPRGIRLSTAFRCFDSQSDRAALRNDEGVPDPGTEMDAHRKNDKLFAEACARDGGPLIDHMSTANVARDMEMLRRALGEEQIDYFGNSYGTVIGATYANLFTASVRLMALDGALDPVEWFGDESTSREPLYARNDRAASQQSTLDEFFRLCDEAPEECALAPSSRARFDALLDRAGSPGGLMFPGGSNNDDGEPGPVDRQELVSRVEAGTLFSGSWTHLAEELADAERGDLSYDALYDLTDVEVVTEFDFREGYFAVVCGETSGPADWDDIAGHAADEQAQHGLFGTDLAWSTSECAVWPGQDDDRYTGPWGAVTEHPILITNSTFDPATSIRGARALNDLLGNSVLVEAEAWGHISWFHNECALDVIETYFETMTVPEDGTVCPGDGNPFLIEDDPIDDDAVPLTDEENECLDERGVALDEVIEYEDAQACLD